MAPGFEVSEAHTGFCEHVIGPRDGAFGIVIFILTWDGIKVGEPTYSPASRLPCLGSGIYPGSGTL